MIVVGRVLNEAGDDVLARWRDARIDQRRDDDVDVGRSGELAVLGLVVGRLQIVDARRDGDVAPQDVGRLRGRLVNFGSRSTARLTLPELPRNL